MSFFNKIRNIFYIIVLILLSSCGGKGSCPPDNNSNQDLSNLMLIAPMSTYTTDIDGYTYITVYNSGTFDVHNISYNLNNQIGSGSLVSIDQASAQICSYIAAGSQCTFKVKKPLGGVAGSFDISINGATNTTMHHKTIGIEQAFYNDLVGADGVSLSYYETVIAGVPYIMVTGLVASSNTGTFNNVVLVDGNNNPIPNQIPVSGNLGANMSNLVQGSTFSILLPVSGSPGTTQIIKVKTEELASDGSVISSNISNLNKTLVTVNNVAIINMLPNGLFLNAEHPEQEITLSNTGNVVASLQALQSLNSNVEVIFEATSLVPGATTIVKVRLKDTSIAATNTNIILTYNNGREEIQTSGVLHLNVDQNPTPVPTPTTEPSPAPTIEPTSEPTSEPTVEPTSEPTPDPVSGLMIDILPDSDFFVTTNRDRITRQVKITNTGNTDEGDIKFQLPTNFTLAEGVENSCVLDSDVLGKIRGFLGATESCYVTLVYQNNTLTDEGVANIAIEYRYDYNAYEDGILAPAQNIAVNYRVSPSVAILTLVTPWNPYNFTNIQSNNQESIIQEFVIYNSGEAPALNVLANLSSSGIFTLNNNLPTTINNGESSSVFITFGTSNVLGTYATNLSVNYESYAGSTASPVSVAITGSVSNAIVSLTNISATGFAGGNGQSVTTAYAVESGTTGQITLTYQNTGNESAQNFKLASGTINDKLSGTMFTVVTDGCNFNSGGITLESGQSCSEVLAFTPNGKINTLLPLDTSSWTYNYGDSFSSGYTYNSAPVYVLGYNPAQVVITAVDTTIQYGSDKNTTYVTVRLVDGYNVVNQTISTSGASCSVSSVTPVCEIQLTPPINTSAGNYTFTFSNSGIVPIVSGNPVVVTVLAFEPDFYVTPMGVTHPSETFALDLFVQNLGNGASYPYPLEVTLPPELAFTGGDPTSLTCNIQANGQKCTSVPRVRVLPDTPPGYYNITVRDPNSGVTSVITIAVANVKDFTYIASSVTSGGLQVEVCDFTPATLTTCRNAGVAIANKPYGTTIAPNGLYAYVMTGADGSAKTGGIYKCDVNQEDKTLSNCVLSVNPGVVNTRAGVVSANGKFLYFNSMDKSTVDRCDIATDGSLSNCKSVVTGLSRYVERLVLDYNGQNLFVNTGAGTRSCKLDSVTGDSLGCKASGYNGSSIGLNFNFTNTFMYFTPTTKCNYDSNTQTVSNCGPSGATGLTGLVTGIGFSEQNAFVTSTSDVFSCRIINPNTGMLGACTPAVNSNAPRAEGITVFN